MAEEQKGEKNQNGNKQGRSHRAALLNLPRAEAHPAGLGLAWDSALLTSSPLVPCRGPPSTPGAARMWGKLGPTAQTYPSACFCTFHELRTGFTFFNGQKNNICDTQNTGNSNFDVRYQNTDTPPLFNIVCGCCPKCNVEGMGQRRYRA